jgi:hypothetical protein
LGKLDFAFYGFRDFSCKAVQVRLMLLALTGRIAASEGKRPCQEICSGKWQG